MQKKSSKERIISDTLLCGLVECQKRRDSQRQDINQTRFILILLLFIWSIMIIRFCILPASLSGAGKTAEKCSGQSNDSKNPRALGDFPSVGSDSLREASEAQTFRDCPKPQASQHPTQNHSSRHFCLLIRCLRDRRNRLKHFKQNLYAFFKNTHFLLLFWQE